ncbi:hypothetical protein A2628_02285 [Candidatus Woesebacteria bacterium RIFCSPHIGHO2_01_FULL_40_22]|uniref:Glycosyl transferase family 1 domain-containing protein n=1 Tax=Candidatus Woesebacteria bacterium RIFCSPHIGHO2_01_FULL_40_22 TaxID=1802499 RepID=A0A1F7YJR3_9BACT|nr:MAG: hypothetical protein A2628_02285 [Candidatus Woesebacteria bacterium RIFCSPHIGHO2_01_FULL_40_22]
MAFAQALNASGYTVDVAWRDKAIKEQLGKRFGMDLKNINFTKERSRGDGYDVCFWISDGSIPLLRARKNFLHFQFPFKNVNGRSLLNKMKLYRIDKIICNSYFTKSFIDEEYGVNSVVIYPPVDVEKIKLKRKENIILYVGRFSQLTQAKNQDMLITLFKKLVKKENLDWKLVLAGGGGVGVGDYLNKLRKLAKGYPIDVLENPDLKSLRDLYGKSKIFWSAVGYGAIENKDPLKVEHFGISLVEAMAGGCVPIVYNAGGYKEIVADGINGYLWKKEKDLLNETKTLINNQGIMRSISSRARSDSKVYEYDRFEGEVESMI